jgi:N utilization substance protein B
MATGSRRRGRTAAFQALYEADTSRHAPPEALERIVARERLSRETAGFAQDLIQGVLTQQDEIDEMIARTATAWPVEQLSAVDRNILRLAIREMLGDNGSPVAVAINEAVELAKRFGSDTSAKFVNGVLGSIQRERDDAVTDHPAGGRRRAGGNGL